MRGSGKKIPDALAQASKVDGNYRPPGTTNEAQKSLLKQMQQYVAAGADDLGIAAATLTEKRDLSAVIINGDRDSRLLTGWRKELVGDELFSLPPAN